MNLHPLLKQVRTTDRSVDTPDERTARKRDTAAELRLWRRTHSVPERLDLTRSVVQKSKEDLFGEWRAAMS